LKSKRFLLSLTEKLTEGNLESMHQYKINPESDPSLPESQENFKEISEVFTKEKVGWNKFTEVFMVSALSGEGVGDIKVGVCYFLQ
jgi:hypothetical protein